MQNECSDGQGASTHSIVRFLNATVTGLIVSYLHPVRTHAFPDDVRCPLSLESVFAVFVVLIVQFLFTVLVYLTNHEHYQTFGRALLPQCEPLAESRWVQ